MVITSNINYFAFLEQQLEKKIAAQKFLGDNDGGLVLSINVNMV